MRSGWPAPRSAAAYGEHPGTAAPRMRWARQVVQDTFPRCFNRRRESPRLGRRRDERARGIHVDRRDHRARSG